jgi:D-apiose dehydrogenase
MKKLKFAVFGCGFWSQFQIGAWQELGGVELVALFNRTRSKAEAFAKRFNVSRVYDTAEELLSKEKLDFVDIITDVDTHEKYTCLAAAHKVPVICQKPMAPGIAAARRMLDACRSAGVPLFIHENWRWQTAIRAFKSKLDSGVIGHPFRARITYSNSFPVFKNQPFLRELEQFMLTDMGAHIFDVARCLFGEAVSLYCQTASINPGIKGEDVATVLLKMKSGLHCTIELSYASPLEYDRPETYILVEGERGSIELAPDLWVRTTMDKTTESKRVTIPEHSWMDPAYAVVHSSIYEENRNLLQALTGEGKAETTGEDNFKTLTLIYLAYESARENSLVLL